MSLRIETAAPLPEGRRYILMGSAANPATLFAYGWVNPRFGKAIKEIHMHGTTGFIDTRGRPTPDNAIVLAGLSVVKKKPVPGGEVKR